MVEQTESGKKQACKFNLIDTLVALNIAFFVNAAILIVAASVFFKNGVIVTEIQQAYKLLTPLLGTTLAGLLFACALLASGQSSTLTGTYAGQIVMEGFLHFKMRPVLRRLITRLFAIIPAVVVISLQGEGAALPLLILSQVILSMQLPFAILPLIQLTNDRKLMGNFANGTLVKTLAWISAAVILVLNVQLAYGTIMDWMTEAGSMSPILWMIIIPAAGGIAFLLVYIALPRAWRRREIVLPAQAEELEKIPKTYAAIGVALDLGDFDVHVLAHAQTFAGQHKAQLILMHVVEGVGGQLFGNEAFDDEARGDMRHLEQHAEQLRQAGFEAKAVFGFGKIPNEIVRLSKENRIDLLVMGSHGHTGLKDLIFGTSISKVRHGLKIPVLVVQ